MIAATQGVLSNLALTVPLALVVVFGAAGWIGESWLIPRFDRPQRTAAERDRDRRRRERRRAREREAMPPHKERNRSA